MELKLAENIRRFRKEKKLTQEQLAEVLGVTVGAVSKWESSATTPELSMLVELASYFGTSVDVLLGYRLEIHSLPQMLEEIKELRDARNFEEAIKIGEEALKKFPNNFDAVYQTALCYFYASNWTEDESNKIHRGRLLFQKALGLFDQNNDPEITEWLIKNQLAEAFRGCGDTEMCLKIFKETNFNGINDSKIAQHLSDVMKRSEEAEPYARRSFRKMVENVVNTMVALASCDLLKETGDFNICVEWLMGFLESIRPEKGVCVHDKIAVNLYQALCESYCEAGDLEKAELNLKKAFLLAKEYDETPAADIVECRFFPEKVPEKPYFDFGAGAREYMEIRFGWECNSEEKFPIYHEVWEKVVSELNLQE